MAESLQHKLDRVRSPRVHITYDVETGGAIESKELPFALEFSVTSPVCRKSRYRGSRTGSLSS